MSFIFLFDVCILWTHFYDANWQRNSLCIRIHWYSAFIWSVPFPFAFHFAENYTWNHFLRRYCHRLIHVNGYLILFFVIRCECSSTRFLSHSMQISFVMNMVAFSIKIWNDANKDVYENENACLLKWSFETVGIGNFVSPSFKSRRKKITFIDECN